METPAAHAAKQLARELGSRKSVEVVVRCETTDHNPGAKKPDFTTQEDHYIETAAGQRFGEFRGLLEGKVTSRAASYGDGTKFADVNYNHADTDHQNMVVIKRQYSREDTSDRKEIPEPLLFDYVGRDPLPDALPKAQHLGKAKVIGRDCEVFLFEKVRWAVVQDQVFSLDEETSTPLKVEAFRDKAAREKNEPMFVWTAESLDRVAGHPVVLTSTETAFAAGKPTFRWDSRVESVVFDKDYPASTFWPKLDPGVTVLNSLTGKTSTVPGARKTTPAPKAQTQAASTAGSGRAVPPTDWSSMAFSVSLGLGLVVLFVGLGLWARRR